MPVKLPNLQDLATIAETYSLSLTEQELATFQSIAEFRGQFT